MRTKIEQIHARLEWASTLSSWKNVHDEMKPAVSGLIRRRLLAHRSHDHALTITPSGQKFLEAHSSDGATFWQDPWCQQIPR